MACSFNKERLDLLKLTPACKGYVYKLTSSASFLTSVFSITRGGIYRESGLNGTGNSALWSS